MKKSDIVKAITQATNNTTAPGVNPVNSETASLVINVVFEKIAEALTNADHYNQDNFGSATRSLVA